MAGLLSYFLGTSAEEAPSKPVVRVSVTSNGEKYESVLVFTQSLDVDPPIDIYKTEDDAEAVPVKENETITIEVEGRPAKDIDIKTGQQTVNFASENEQLAEVYFMLSKKGLTITQFQLQLKGEDADGQEAVVAAAAVASVEVAEEEPESKSGGKKKKKKKGKKRSSDEGKDGGPLSEEMVEEYKEADKDCATMEASLVQQMLELTMNPTDNKAEQESQLEQRLVMVRSMKKNLIAYKDNNESLTDELKERIRQLAVRDVMQLQLDQLLALNDDANQQRIKMVRESIANMDLMLSKTPSQLAAAFWADLILQNNNAMLQMQQQLSQMQNTEVDAKQAVMKERAVQQMGHRIFITQQVIDRLKAFDVSTLTHPKQANEEKNQVLKHALKARIDWLEANEPEAEAIKPLTAQWEEMEKGNFQQPGGGHGHSHGGQHGHSHNGQPCGGHGPPAQQHGHSHNGQPCGGHGPRPQQHGHSHNGQPCGGHGPRPQQHGHSHNGQPCGGHGPPAQQQQHGHSHNGAPCGGHGPAAGASHGHSHAGGDHGHSHGEH